MCMSFVAVGRTLMIFSYVTFKMAALWFWTMFNCNPPISPCYPLIWGGGILVDHWSTISSFTRYSFSEITCSCQDHKISKNASILTNKVRDKSKSTWMWRFAQWMHHEVHGGGKIAQPSVLGFCLHRKWNGAFTGQNITPMWLWDQQVLVFPGDLTTCSIQAWINNTKMKTKWEQWDKSNWDCMPDRLIHIKGILPKGPYQPCLSMPGRALLAGYPRYVSCT